MAGLLNGQLHDRDALILYGSETGNSEDAAEDLGRMAERLHFRTRVCEMDRVELNHLLGHTVVIFVVSTTGQGEFPVNARKFWKSLLRKRLPPHCLRHVWFTTLGFGDSSYPKYNITAKKLHKRLEQLGANEVYPRGEADEQHPNGIDDIFLSWSVDLRTRLLSLYPLPEGMEPIPPGAFLPPSHYVALAESLGADRNGTQGTLVEPCTEAVSSPSSLSAAEENIVPDPFTMRGNQTINEVPPSLASSPIFPYRPKSEGSGQTTSTALNALTSQDSTSRMANMTGSNGLEWQVNACVKDFSESEVITYSDTPSTTRLPIPGSLELILVENKRYTPEDHFQDVRLLTFELSSKVIYSPGDSITIYPKNFDEDVKHVIQRCGWDKVADRRLKPLWNEERTVSNLAGEGQLRWKDGIHPYNRQPTLRELLTHHLDINAIPRRCQFEFMQTFAENDDERNRLIELASPVYSEEFFDYATRPRRSILELLDDFPSVKLPWVYVVTFFPLIRGRQYSICTGGFLSSIPGHLNSSPRSGYQRIQILIALVKYQTVIKKIRQGLCSRYVASLPEGLKINATLEPNPSMYPRHVQDITTPLLMIASGTGIAPIRSIIWDRAHRELEVAEALLDDAIGIAKEHARNPFADSSPFSPDLSTPAHSVDTTPGDKLLFFGNRNEAKDFFFRQEFCNLAMLRTQVFTAFSRDQREKIYVQDIIREQAQLVVDFIEKKNAVVYLCGSSGKMPLAVKDAIADCLEKYSETYGLKGNKEHCVAFVDALERMQRWIQETW